MNRVKNLLRTILILPLTAGNLNNRRQNGHFRSDGSIAGMMLLTTMVAIAAEITYVFQSIEIKHEKTEGKARQLLLVVYCTGIISCIALRLKDGSYSRLTFKINAVHVTECLKLKFMYLFCVGCMVYRVLRLVIHIRCDVYVREYDSLELSVVYDTFAGLYYIVQTWFITYFSRYGQLRSSMSTMYLLIMITVANASSWTKYATGEHGFINVGNSSSIDYYGRCSPNNGTESSIEKILFEHARPFVEPMLLEYPLLCLMFLSEMFSREHQNDRKNEDDSGEVFDSEWTSLLGTKAKS